MTRAALFAAALFAALVLLAACDAAPGLPGEVRRPSVTAFSLSPEADSLATDAPTAAVPLVLDVAIAGEGRVLVRALVRYAEAPRVTGLDTLVAEVEVEVEPGDARIEIPLTLPRGATGAYAVTLATQGRDGRQGDGASGTFRFRAASLGPPVIAGVEAETVVTRPPAGTPTVRTLPITVAVTDPDGRANVAAVLFVDGNGGVIGPLFDEGRSGRGSADQTAADGRYTAAIQIVAPDRRGALEPGVYELFIVAVDRAGEQSAPVPFTFEVR